VARFLDWCLKGTAGQPVRANAFLDMLIDVFFFLVPWTWAASAGWFTPPLSTLLCVLYLGLADLGLMLEQPFEGAGIALDMERFCKVRARRWRLNPWRKRLARLREYVLA